MQLGSDNANSLLLCFDAALYTSDGGMYPGGMPVLRTDGVYRDLVKGDPVSIEWIDEPVTTDGEGFDGERKAES